VDADVELESLPSLNITLGRFLSSFVSISAGLPGGCEGHGTHMGKKRERGESPSCGRCTVSLAGVDADVEPDGCMLPEKLRLLELAGIDTSAGPVPVCGCRAAGELIPRDVLRALRVLVGAVPCKFGRAQHGRQQA